VSVNSKILWAAAIVALCIVVYLVYLRGTEPTQNTTPTPTPVPTTDSDTVTDVEGNVYKVIKIGDQLWMAENLKTTKYNDGTDIPIVTDNYAWGDLTTPAYCWYNNDPANGDAYGTLYNWYAVDTGKLAPEGWHVPTKEDWETLSKYLGGDYNAGGKLKEKGNTHWFRPNIGATDEANFTAIPCGTRNYDGLHFYGLGDSCYFWASTESDASNAWVRQMTCDSAGLKVFYGYKSYGRPIRCVKDP